MTESPEVFPSQTVPPDSTATAPGAANLETGTASSPSAGYGISEVSDMTGISAFTIRYYDKCGFFPNLARDKRGVRSFTDADVDQLHLVEALRKSGLSIEGIQYYVRLSKRGAQTEVERLSILQARETVLEYQRDELDLSLQRLRAAAMELSGEHDGQRP